MTQNKLLNRVYHPVETPLPCNSTLIDFKHHCLPGLNLIAKESVTISSVGEISKLYDEPWVNVKKPLPCLFHEPALGLCNEDPALKIVREKYFWKRRKKQMLELIHKKYKGKGHFRVSSIESKKTDRTAKLPYGITRLADHLARNPDKHFKGLYNWYFDSALAAIKSREEPYLLHAGGEQLDHLYISSTQADATSQSISVVYPKFNISFRENGPIFDIISSRENDRIGIRQRNLCTFFIFEKDSDIHTIANKSFSISCGNHPFVSADIGGRRICTIDANRRMKLWSVAQQKCIEEATLPQSESFLSDKFARVEFSKNDKSVVTIDRKNVYFFDTRQSLAQPSATWSCENYFEMCENVSLMVSSAKDNYYYIGANHTCLLLDNRSGFVQKWSHMLPQTPAVGHALQLDVESGRSKETLIICTQNSNDVIAICHNWSSEPSITCLPFSLPNRIDTLHEARANGVLYHPVLQNKFDFSVIGLTSFDVSQRPKLFSLISTGDMFQQNLNSKEHCSIYDHSNRLAEKQLSYLEKWENNFIKAFSNRNKPHQVVTHTVSMNELFSKLEHVEVPEWKSKPANMSKIKKFTKKELESYTDLLAPCLLNDFGILDDSDWEDEEGNHNILDISSKSIDKVQNWLHTSDNEFSEASMGENDIDKLLEDPEKDSEEDSQKDNTSILSIELSDDEL